MSDMPKVIWVHYTMDYCSDEPIEECEETKYIRADLVEPQADAKHPNQDALDALDDIQEFVNNSHGIMGWHENGALAEWDEFDIDNYLQTIRNYIEWKDDD